jgi:hypothetical protein
VAVRHRTAGDQGQVPISEFVQRAKQEVGAKALAVG